MRSLGRGSDTRSGWRSRHKHSKDSELFPIPDLPPIASLRRALVRSAVSGAGRRPVPPYVDYSLPADKPRLASASADCYRTDLRAAFQEPYCDVGQGHGVGFNEPKFLALNRHHLKHNTAHTPNRTEIEELLKTIRSERASLDMLQRQVDPATRRVVQQYRRTAPQRRPQEEELRRRSGRRDWDEEVVRVVDWGTRAEQMEVRRLAERLVESVNREDKEEESCSVTEGQTDSGVKSMRARRRATAIKPRLPLTEAGFTTFEDFQTTVPDKHRPEMPSFLQQDEDTRKAWNWVTDDDVVDKFSYFVSLCS